MDADRSRRAPPSSAGSPTGRAASLPPGGASCSSAPIPTTWNGCGRSAQPKGCRWTSGRGTRGDLRAFADRLRDAGCSWVVVLPVGGEDRLELVAEALRGMSSGALKRAKREVRRAVLEDRDAIAARCPRRVGGADRGAVRRAPGGPRREHGDAVLVVRIRGADGALDRAAPRPRGHGRPPADRGRGPRAGRRSSRAIRCAPRRSAPSSRSTRWALDPGLDRRGRRRPGSPSTGSAAGSATEGGTTTGSCGTSPRSGSASPSPIQVIDGQAPGGELRPSGPRDRDGGGNDQAPSRRSAEAVGPSSARLEQPFNLVIRGAHGRDDQRGREQADGVPRDHGQDRRRIHGRGGVVLGHGLRRPGRRVHEPFERAWASGTSRRSTSGTSEVRTRRRRRNASTPTTSSACRSARCATARSSTRTASWSTTAPSSSTPRTTCGSARTGSITRCTSPTPRRASTSRSRTSRRICPISRCRARGRARRCSRSRMRTWAASATSGSCRRPSRSAACRCGSRGPASRASWATSSSRSPSTPRTSGR